MNIKENKTDHVETPTQSQATEGFLTPDCPDTAQNNEYIRNTDEKKTHSFKVLRASFLHSKCRRTTRALRDFVFCFLDQLNPCPLLI